VVDHEAALRQHADGLERGGQLARPHEHVVSEAGLTDRAQSPADIATQEPVRVGLVVHLMADAHEVTAAGAVEQRGDGLADGRIGKVDPADDAADERRRPG